MLFKEKASNIVLKNGKSVEEAIGTISVVDIVATPSAGNKLELELKLSDGTSKKLNITLIP